MALQLGALRDALLDAGASPEKAEKAAEELIVYDSRLAGIEHRLAVVSWQIGALTAVVVAVGAPAVWLLPRVAAKMGAIG
jgi:hypothetical protein